MPGSHALNSPAPTNSPATSVFASLDTLLLIVVHLPVPDLVRFSLTNRKIYRDVHGNRIIWLRALVSIETSECMIPLTYKVELMSLDALKLAACAPYRLASAIFGRGSVNASVKTFSLETAQQGPPPQYAIYLVPGGRWIIYTDRGEKRKSGGSARISCADLYDFKPAERSSSFSLRHPVDTWPTISAVQSNPEESAITVAVTYQHTFPLRCIEILQAAWPQGGDPEAMPTWQSLAYLEIDMDEPIRSLSLEDGVVVLPLARSVVVWRWGSGEWASVVWGVHEMVRDVWHTPTHLFVVSGTSNTVHVLEMPALSPVDGPPAEHQATPVTQLEYKKGGKVYCELAVLSSWTPLPHRSHRLASLIYWNREASGLLLIDFSDPLNLKIVEDWENTHEDDTYGVHSGALQTVDVKRIAIRAGRRFLSRLQRGPDSEEIEFRAIGYFRGIAEAKAYSIGVPLQHTEWDQAEAYDSCTIFGRVLLRQYDSSSDSEVSSTDAYPQLALLDFS